MESSIQYYLVTIDQVENATSFTLIVNTTQIVVRNLLPYYTYIAAVTTPGTGPWSNLLTVTLPEAGEHASVPNKLAPTKNLILMCTYQMQPRVSLHKILMDFPLIIRLFN